MFLGTQIICGGRKQKHFHLEQNTVITLLCLLQSDLPLTLSDSAKSLDYVLFQPKCWVTRALRQTVATSAFGETFFLLPFFLFIYFILVALEYS